MEFRRQVMSEDTNDQRALQPLAGGPEAEANDITRQYSATSVTGDRAQQASCATPVTTQIGVQQRRVRFIDTGDEVETGDGGPMPTPDTTLTTRAPVPDESEGAEVAARVGQYVDAMLDGARLLVNKTTPIDAETLTSTVSTLRVGSDQANMADITSVDLITTATTPNIAGTMAVQLGEIAPDDDGATPTEVTAAFALEIARRDEAAARVLRVRAVEQRAEVAVADETARRLHKTNKRRERMRNRHARRTAKQQELKLPITTETIATVTSVRSATDLSENAKLAPNIMAEADVDMPEPSDAFRNALKWSVRAVVATEEVRARQQILADGLARLAESETTRLEELAAGGVVGENDTRPGVAVQLVTAAEGLKTIGEDTWVEMADEPIRVSRARRRQEKRVRKARAKERRERLAQKQEAGYPIDSFFSYDEHRRTNGRAKVLNRSEAEAIGHALPYATATLKKLTRSRKKTKKYVYRSGSQYESQSTLMTDGKVYNVGKLRAVQAPTTDLLPTAMLEVRGQWRPVKLDTGAQYSVAGKLWAQYGTQLNTPSPVDFMEGFSGAAVRVLGVWRFELKTTYLQPMRVDALIVEHDTTDFLIGEDWMYDHGVKIDFVSGEMKWYDDNDKLVVPFTGLGTSAQRNERVAKVRLLRRAKVQTQTVRNVEVAVPAEDGTVGLFVPKPRKERHLLVAPTVVTVRGGKATVPILNLVGRTTKLPSREALGTWTPLNEELEILELEGELDRERVSQWVDSLSTHKKPLVNEDELAVGDMSTEDKSLLLKLLRHFPQMLEPRDGCPPATTLGVEHHINTGDAAPVRTRPRRYSRSEHGVIDGEVDQMLHDGVIEESTGAWGFPVVLVRKKDGSVRFCVDYRMLNSVTKKDIYPLPRIDEALESMHGAKRFSSLDMHAGYWQVPVATGDRDKTGFVTRKGLFRFVRMPFGLANAPGTFQRMMDAVLRGLTWKSCLVYLDDVIIFSGGGVHRHVVDLAIVMERLARAGLSLKPKKCSFAMERLEYLGHELDAEGIRPLETLVNSVRQFPVPSDQAEVRRFVHLAGYYRRFVPNFGTKAAPLTMLLRKATEWQWGSEQHDAFEKLKAELTERPLLIYPDFTKPFKLVTDASVVGLGAALMQDHGHGDQPVAFASKVNSPTVAKYGITDLECAAVVWAVRLFRPYLYGRRFELVTDHSALTWLMKSKDLSGRLHRWALQLQEYDFSIIYRAGSTNVVADALSRAPVRTLTAEGQLPPAGTIGDSEVTVQSTTTAVGASTGETRASTDEQGTGINVQRVVTTGLNSTTMPSNRQRSSTEPDRAPDPENGQLTDDEIRLHQVDDKFVRRLKETGSYKGQKLKEINGVVHVRGADGVLRVVLPVALRAKALREAHDSIYAGHLRTPQTFARVTNTYWWPDVRTQVKLWVRSCRDCGTRKTQPKAVIPPLRSQGVGDVGDRWAIDVAGPLPVTPNGNRYVIAAIDYASRYAIAVATPSHTAEHVARFIAERVVLVHGPMRELTMDGAPELNGKVVKQLAKLLQARQMTPVPYRPMLLGLVERYHKVWKDMVSMYVDEQQDDWDQWLPSAAYAYNGARHGTTGFTPNELMMGRRLRSPNELLRTSRVTMVGKWSEYHRQLVKHLERASEVAKLAIRRDQLRRERYYNQRVRERSHYAVGDIVWILKPPRGKGVTKLAHQWVGPARIDADAGFDNWRVTRLDTQDDLIVHCSFLLSYHYPPGQRETVADKILRELADGEAENAEDVAEERHDNQEHNHIDGQDTQTDSEHVARRSTGQTMNTETLSNTTRAQTAIVEPATSGNFNIGSVARGPVNTTGLGTNQPTASTVQRDVAKVTTEIEGNAVSERASLASPRITGTKTTANRAPTRRQDLQPRDVGAYRNQPHQPDAASTKNGPNAGRQDAVDTKEPTRKRRSEGRAGQRLQAEEELAKQQKRRRVEKEARESRAARRGATRDEQVPPTATTDETNAHSGVLRATRPHETGTTKNGGSRPDDEAKMRRPSKHQDEDEQSRSTIEDGEATIDSKATADALRGRGNARWVPPNHHLLETAARGTVIERARRRVRNKAGRYVLQYQVEFGVRPGGPTTKEWLSAREFEELFDDGKIGDDLLSGNGV